MRSHSSIVKLISRAIAAYAVVVVLLVVGWVLNIINLIEWAKADGPINSVAIMQIVGAFIAPIGGVLGWVF